MIVVIQVLVTAAVVGLITHYVAGQAGPAAIVIGNGLALSSTAVVLQVKFSPILPNLHQFILAEPVTVFWEDIQKTFLNYVLTKIIL